MIVTQNDLVERRQKFIQRQIALDKSAVNVAFAGRSPQGSGPRNRHGMPQLPTGQHQVKNWPVLDLGEQPVGRVAMSSGDRIRNVTKRLRLRAAARLGVTRAVLPGVHHAVERRVLVSRLSRAFHDHRLRSGERALSRLCGQTAIPGEGSRCPTIDSGGGGLAARGDRLSHAACPAARPLSPDALQVRRGGRIPVQRGGCYPNPASGGIRPEGQSPCAPDPLGCRVRGHPVS